MKLLGLLALTLLPAIAVGVLQAEEPNQKDVPSQPATRDVQEDGSSQLNWHRENDTVEVPAIPKSESKDDALQDVSKEMQQSENKKPIVKDEPEHAVSPDEHNPPPAAARQQEAGQVSDKKEKKMQYMWTINRNEDEPKEPCLAGDLTAELQVTYPVGNKKTKTVKLDFTNMTATDMYDDRKSSCVSTTMTPASSYITLSLTLNKHPQQYISFIFHNATSKKSHKTAWMLQEVMGQVQMTPKLFPGYTGKPTTNVKLVYNQKDKLLFGHVPMGSSYKCMQGSPPVAVTKKESAEQVMLKVNDTMLEAFLPKSFKPNMQLPGKPQICREDYQPSDVVPIAVGIALAVLVIIVLVAYLIGRRKARAAGYESM